MARADVIRPYVEQTLKEFFNTNELVVDEDGDWPVRHGSAIYFIRLVDENPPVLSVFSPMLSGIRRSGKVLQALNDLNAQVRFARLFLVEDRVLIATELVAETLDKGELGNAIMSVASIADHFDTELQKVFGGRMAFEDVSNVAAQDMPSDV